MKVKEDFLCQKQNFFVQLILSIAISVAVAAPLAFFMSKKLTQWSEKKIDKIVKEELKKRGLY